MGGEHSRPFLERDSSLSIYVYHERQRRNLCGMHVVNNLLQRAAVTQRNLEKIAASLDKAERKLIKNPRKKELKYWLTGGRKGWRMEPNSNMMHSGNFSIQVLQKALEPFDLRLVSAKDPEVHGADAEAPWGFVVHQNGHWSAMRQIGDYAIWVDLNSTLAKPRLMATEEVLRLHAGLLPSSGALVFCVIGTMPSCPSRRSSHVVCLPVDSQNVC